MHNFSLPCQDSGLIHKLKLTVLNCVLWKLNFSQCLTESFSFFFCFLQSLLFVCSTAYSYWLLPALILKRMVIGNFERGSHDSEMSDAIDFVVDCVSELLCYVSSLCLWTS